MNTSFIPSIHLTVAPPDKLKSGWCMDIIGYYYYNTNNRSLLEDKNVIDVEEYSSGIFSMVPYKRMFKSEIKRMKDNANPNFLNNQQTAIGLDYTALPMLPEKLASATAIVQKIPIEITCVATDALAIEKKQSDVNFLKNKPVIEEDLQVIADRLNLGKVDLGATKNSAVEFSDSPFGLDLQNPDELDIFVNLIYSLKIETAFETILEYYKELKRIDNVKLLEIKDQFKWGLSVHRAFQNNLTGLPDVEYVWPGDVLTPYSNLPDYSDNTHRIIPSRVTPLQLFDYFSSEIGSEEQLEQIINAGKWGYCACNQINPVNRKNWDSFRVNLLYVEVKTVDYIGIKKVNKKSKFKTFTTEPKDATEKIWAQNTYGFWWLQNTDQVFGVYKLPYSQRTKGNESYQNFSTNIYKSQERSAVEQSIGENKNAQIAYIKMQHALIKSKPTGMYIDLRYLRSALDGLKDDTNDWTMDKLLNLAIEQNVVLGDTEDFDGKNDGQFKPTIELPGGLKGEIIGYMNIIAAANINISRITGVNQQLTGASANEEGLVGLQKLLINASINALHYCNEAIKHQYQNLFSIWGNIIQQAIEGGGEPKKAIQNIIGAKKVSIIDGLDDAPLHDIGIFIKIDQREEERFAFRNELNRQKQIGVISAADEFLIDSIQNPKDKWAVMAVKEQQWRKRQDAIRQEQIAAQQDMIAKQGENAVAVQNAETEGNLKEVYAKGDVNAKITTLAAQLGMNEIQLQGLLKKDEQTQRNKAQTDKNIQTLTAKSNLQQQETINA